MPGPAHTLTDAFKARARSEGFDGIGIAAADALSPNIAARLHQFVAEGHHGTMAWMAETADRRADPRVLWPEVRSIAMLAMTYGPETDPLAILEAPDRGAISCYAQGKDYHVVVKKGLKRVAGWLAGETGAQVKVFVDTAPVMEKPLAAAAGLGWQGKHTNLVSRELGSWFFLGAIFTTANLVADRAESDHCGRCRRCLDVCPTDAFPAPYRLDARRCISYLTIEHRGPIPEAFRRPMGNRIFGCDDCLAVCPWNKFAQVARDQRLHPRAGLDGPDLATLLTLDEAGFQAWFQGTPVKRTGRDGLVRNALIAAGNSGRTDLLPAVRARLTDEAAVVRGAAVWALSRLASPDQVRAAAATCQPAEHDPGVRAEWAAVVDQATAGPRDRRLVTEDGTE